MTRVFFVRHAQSDWKSGTDRERGLTGEGREDAGVAVSYTHLTLPTSLIV